MEVVATEWSGHDALATFIAEGKELMLFFVAGSEMANHAFQKLGLSSVGTKGNADVVAEAYIRGETYFSKLIVIIMTMGTMKMGATVSGGCGGCSGGCGAPSIYFRRKNAGKDTVKFITQVHLMTVLNLILHMTGENLLVYLWCGYDDQGF